MIDGDEIAECALKTFEKVPTSKKPRDFRIKGSESVVQEWTVLAAIVKETSSNSAYEDTCRRKWIAQRRDIWGIILCIILTC